MSKPVITYFNFGGRAEASRIAFFIGGVDFEDKRITGEEFGAMKAAGTLPLGSLPTLTVDGNTYAQSNAILRYAGKKSGLYPTNEVEALAVDMVLDCVEEMTGKVPFGGDDIKQKREKWQADVAPKFLACLNKLAKNNAANGYMVGSNLTIADIDVAGAVHFLTCGNLDHIDVTKVKNDYPDLLNVAAKVATHPKVAEWEEAHPKK